MPARANSAPRASEEQWRAYVTHAGTGVLTLGHGMPERTRARRNLDGPARALIIGWMRYMRPRVGQTPSDLERARAQLAEAERVLPERLANATAAEQAEVLRRTRALRAAVERELQRVESLPVGARLREEVLDVLRRARVELASALAALSGTAASIARATGAGLAIGGGLVIIVVGAVILWALKKG
jgi:hypothetical protein